MAQALPFFTLFARRAFDLKIEALGLLVLIDALTPLVGNFVWGRLADARSNRWVIIMAALLGLLAPALCLLLYSQGGSSLSGTSVLAAFSIIVFATGFASVGIDLATKNYILDLAPDDAERPVYIGVNDTLVGLPTMLLAGAGFIIDAFGFAPVFSSIGMIAIAGALLATSLPSFTEGHMQ